VLWRHARTEWNSNRRFQGHADISLDDIGRDQAERAARMLASLEPAAIVSSDLIRAADTAEALARLTGVPVTLDAGLREFDVGTWQGLTTSEIKERFAKDYTAWRHGEPVRRGGGELDAEVAERSAAAIERAAEAGTLVVVSHGGAIRVAIGYMLGLPPDMWGAIGSLANCCWSVLGAARRGWRLLEHNAGTLPEPVIGDDR
jgi:probable phosphoglycerate mutase